MDTTATEHVLVNSDAAIFQNDGSIVVGAIVHDHHEIFLVACLQYMKGLVELWSFDGQRNLHKMRDWTTPSLKLTVSLWFFG
jgi:hypothetical protein